MKRILLYTCLFITFLLRGQTDDYVKPDVFPKKGRTVLSLFLGYNGQNIQSYFGMIYAIDPNLSSSYVSEYAFDASPAYGFTAEHFLSDKFSIGLEFSRASSELVFVNSVSVVDNTGMYPVYNYVQYNYTTTSTSTKVLLRPTFHIGGYKTYDAYFFTGIGFKSFKSEIDTNDPNPIPPDYEYSDIPFCFKPGFGLRMMPIKNLGVQFELAAGNPLVSFGIVGAF